jgi:hypothetical protein
MIPIKLGFGLPKGAGGRLHLASVLQEGRKNANIHARLAVIRVIPGNIFAHGKRAP